jgi:hypothetical protein
MSMEKKISVTFDMNKGQYSGLPTIWRELMEMPLSVSTMEVDTENWADGTIAPVMPSQRNLFKI